ncbi:hypothetical protein LCGC14_3028270 [marine sediment metagenome]|uniref:Uncharacterized protein n=1 Tax=marine sediment metagenome TaxID=412755 RepID=A0A0F8XGD1_9ZZZZ
MILNVTITKTADGKQDYIQIMSDDIISVNIVLVADKIKVEDHRGPKKFVQPIKKKGEKK